MQYLLLFFLGVGWMQHAVAQEPRGDTQPVFNTEAPTRIATGAVYQYKIMAMDSAGASLSFAVPVLPDWLSYDADKNLLRGKTNKPGQYAVKISVSNAHKKTIQQFIITVFDENTSNILCLGNSLTNGTDRYNSYRRTLWQMLNRKNYNIDFIGSWNKHHMGGKVPDPDFDMDHEGHSGWTMEHVLHPPDWDSVRGNISRWLKTYNPDLVLLELGTNDVFQCRKVPEMMQSLEKLILSLRQRNPGVKIFIAEIPPLGPQWSPKKLCGDSVMYETVLLQLNAAIRKFCRQHTTRLSPLIAVDQYTVVEPARDMYDDIHPNEKGEQLMAARWFDAIVPYLKKLP